MDPYVKVQVGKQEYVTKVAHSQGVTPVWNEKCFFELKGTEPDLKFKIYDKDKGKDDYVAAASIPLSSLVQPGNLSRLIPLYTHKGFQKLKKGIEDFSSKMMKKPADYTQGKSAGTLNAMIEFVPPGSRPQMYNENMMRQNFNNQSFSQHNSSFTHHPNNSFNQTVTETTYYEQPQ